MTKQDSNITNYFYRPGGNYLSNEIFYRVAFLRDNDSNNSDKMTGHIHIGYLKDPTNKNAIVNTDRDDMLKQIINSIKNAINGF